jgi:hypothetical protein
MDNPIIHTVLEESYQLWEDATCEDDEAKQTQLLAKARSQLAHALASYPDNANLHHMMGLCWYWDNQDSKEGKPFAEQSFKSALELEPANQYANLYLGHVYFDTARYAEALRLFSKLDAGYFEEVSQRWRNLKNAELILCCRMYLNLEDVKPSEVEEMCLMYESVYQEDSSEPPVPIEILVCVAKLFKSNTDRMTPIASRVIELFRRMEFDQFKWLQKDLLYLQAALAGQN